MLCSVIPPKLSEESIIEWSLQTTEETPQSTPADPAQTATQDGLRHCHGTIRRRRLPINESTTINQGNSRIHNESFTTSNDFSSPQTIRKNFFYERCTICFCFLHLWSYYSCVLNNKWFLEVPSCCYNVEVLVVYVDMIVVVVDVLKCLLLLWMLTWWLLLWMLTWWLLLNHATIER